MTDDQLAQLFVLDAQPGPALPIAAADADALVAAALAGAGFGPGGGPGSDGGGSSPAAHEPSPAGVAARRVGGIKLAGAMIAITVVVFVIAFLVGRHRAHQIVAAPPDAAPDAAVLAVGGSAAPAIATTAPPIPADVPAPAPAPATTEPAPTTTAPAPAAPHHATAATDAHAVNDLLGEANAKRAAHEWRASDALYARVVKRVPGTAAAQTALVASASLHLEHLGDPRGAAQRFRRALAIDPNGGMAEEARWGIAEAARARHDAAGEAAALDEFLAHYPDSPLAAGARARRQELK